LIAENGTLKLSDFGLAKVGVVLHFSSLRTMTFVFAVVWVSRHSNVSPGLHIVVSGP
jgi:hypothetical protein